MLEIKMISFDELSNEEKENVPNNGSGKEYANYIKILHNGKTICLHSDAMEPEDAVFYRDLSWISELLKRCYNLGKQDELNEETEE